MEDKRDHSRVTEAEALTVLAYFAVSTLGVCLFVDKVLGLEGSGALMVALPFALFNGLVGRRMVLRFLRG